jgi:hypothetical protein
VAPGAYPKRKHLKCPTIRFALPSNSKTRLKRGIKGKPSRLLGLVVSDEGKKFYNMISRIPADIDFSKNYHWLMKNFPPDVRLNSIIFEDEVNVLRPEVIQAVRNVTFKRPRANVIKPFMAVIYKFL